MATQNAIELGSPPCSPQIPHLRSGTCGPGPRSTPSANQLADAVAVQSIEGTAIEQPELHVRRHDAGLHVVAAEPEGHLGEVVGAEADEVGVSRQLGRGQSGPGRLDHGADGDALEPERLDLGLDPASHHRQLPFERDERNHDLHHGITHRCRCDPAWPSSTALTWA